MFSLVECVTLAFVVLCMTVCLLLWVRFRTYRENQLNYRAQINAQARMAEAGVGQESGGDWIDALLPIAAKLFGGQGGVQNQTENSNQGLVEDGKKVS